MYFWPWDLQLPCYIHFMISFNNNYYIKIYLFSCYLFLYFSCLQLLIQIKEQIIDMLESENDGLVSLLVKKKLIDLTCSDCNAVFFM